MKSDRNRMVSVNTGFNHLEPTVPKIYDGPHQNPQDHGFGEDVHPNTLAELNQDNILVPPKPGFYKQNFGSQHSLSSTHSFHSNKSRVPTLESDFKAAYPINNPQIPQIPPSPPLYEIHNHDQQIYESQYVHDQQIYETLPQNPVHDQQIYKTYETQNQYIREQQMYETQNQPRGQPIQDQQTYQTQNRPIHDIYEIYEAYETQSQHDPDQPTYETYETQSIHKQSSDPYNRIHSHPLQPLTGRPVMPPIQTKNSYSNTQKEYFSGPMLAPVDPIDPYTTQVTTISDPHIIESRTDYNISPINAENIYSADTTQHIDHSRFIDESPDDNVLVTSTIAATKHETLSFSTSSGAGTSGGPTSIHSNNPPLIDRYNKDRKKNRGYSNYALQGGGKDNYQRQ